MTNNQKTKCHDIIYSAANDASVATTDKGSLALINFSDEAVITPIQLNMAISLAKVFDKKINKNSAINPIASAIASQIKKKTISQIIVGFIPDSKNIFNATTAFSLTETLGWKLVEEFEKK
jgi:uncharacterized protein (DUF697 family)